MTVDLRVLEAHVVHRSRSHETTIVAISDSHHLLVRVRRRRSVRALSGPATTQPRIAADSWRSRHFPRRRYFHNLALRALQALHRRSHLNPVGVSLTWVSKPQGIET